MGWTAASIEAVKHAVVCGDVVGSDTKLEKEGGDLVGCCVLPGHKDDTPSLRVNVAKNVWRCFGCGHGGSAVDWLMKMRSVDFREAIEELADRTGVTLIEEVPEVKVPVARRMVASWQYDDADGQHLYTVERWEPGKRGRRKDYLQRLADGSYHKSPVQVLYRLPEVQAAAWAGQTVYVCEGEKAADALRTLGVCATTSAGGSSATDVWLVEGFAEPLRGATVVLLPDNDAVGHKHMAKVAKALADVAGEVLTVRLVVPNEGDDAVEWIAEGGTLERLQGLVDTVRARQVEQTEKVVTSASAAALTERSTMLTDTANAEVWVQLFGDRYRWDQTAGDWLGWDGRRWRREQGGEALHSTKAIAKHWLRRIADDDLSKDERQEMLKHAQVAESLSRRKAILDLAKAEPGISVRAGELDADPWLINCLNGVLDLRTGSLSPHTPERLMTKLAPVVYDRGAQAPRFERFLSEVLPDVDVRRYLMRVLGYGMTGVVREHIMPVLWGAAGRNGKGTLVEATFGCLGDYAMPVPTELIVERRQQQHPNLVAQLLGARLCVAAEIKATDRVDEAQVKNLTGGDSLRARFLGKEFFTFAATHKLLLQTNHKPRAPADPALFARMRVIPFEVSFLGREDPTLKATLAQERPGILAHLVRACLEWQRDGLGSASAIDEATAEYKEESDPIGQFLSENVVHQQGAQVSGSQLYSEYRKWAETRGEAPWTLTAFGRDLPAKGLRKVKKSGTVFYVGIGMRSGTVREGLGQFAGPSRISLDREAPTSKTLQPSPTLPNPPYESPENEQSMFWDDDESWDNRSD
jgi:putative DNA primase/helicase